MKVRNKWIAFLIALLAVSLVITGCQGATTPEDKPEIVIGKDPYSNEWVPAGVIKLIAEELGYPASYQEGDMGFMWLGVAQGEIDIFPDAWLPTLHSTYYEEYKDDFEIVGTLYEDATMGIGVPTYVDVDTLAELKGRGAEFKNEIIGIEPSAGIMITAEETLDVYDLKDEYELVPSSTAAMLAAVDKAVRSEEPILFLPWRPHTMFVNYDIKLLEDNQGIWEFDDCKILAAHGLKEKAPDIYSFLQNFKMSISEIEELMLEIEQGRNFEEVAQEWIGENRDRIDEMLGK